MSLQSFKDTQGRLWNLRLTIRVGGLIKTKHGFDPFTSFKDEWAGLRALIENPVDLVNVLYEMVCDPNSGNPSPSPSPEEFAMLLSDGQVLGEAADALVMCVANFFHRRVPAILSTMKQKTTDAVEILLTEDEAAMEAITPAQIAEMLRAKAKARVGGIVHSKSPASLELTPVI